MKIDSKNQLKQDLGECLAARAWSEQIGYAMRDRITELEDVLSQAETQMQDLIDNLSDYMTPSKLDYEVLAKIKDAITRGQK